MAHPKRKHSKTRTAKRRTHYKAVAPTLAVCSNCGAIHIYHTVCRITSYNVCYTKLLRRPKAGW